MKHPKQQAKVAPIASIAKPVFLLIISIISEVDLWQSVHDLNAQHLTSKLTMDPRIFVCQWRK